MGLELINKRHPLITTNKNIGGHSFIKFHNTKQIYFSITAVKELGLAVGLYFHVVNDDDKWFFYVNNDNDGFYMSQHPTRHTIDIFSASLIHLFIKRTRHTLPCKFPLRITGNKQDGNHLIEIMQHQPLNK